MQMVANTVRVVRDAILSTVVFQTASKTVNMKLYNRCLIRVITTGSGTASGALTLKQSTVAAGSDEKALTFTDYYYSTDAITSDALTKGTASSNTFNVTAANGATRVFEIEVRADMLDIDNGFVFLRADIASVATCMATLEYILYEARQVKGGDAMPTAIS